MKQQIWKWVLIPFLFFSIAASALTFPMVFHLKDAVLDPADPMLNAWILAWDAHILPRDPLALFHANDFYPYSNTLAYSETLLGQALFTSPLIWLTQNPILAVNVVWLASFILSGLGMYALVYHFTRQTGAALVAGMVFAFNPFRFAHLSHIQLLTAQWVPLVFLFLDRLVMRHRWRDAVCFTFFFNLQVLSCYYYAFFLATAIAVLLIGYCLLDRRRFGRRLLLRLLIFATITLAIQVPLSIPYFTVSRSMDFERSLDDVVRGAADLTDFITAPEGNRLYGEPTASLRGEGWWEHVAFPGAVATVLGVLGLARGSKGKSGARRARRLYLLVTGVVFVLSLGPALRLDGRILFSPMPYRLLYEGVPGFRAIRQPARFHMFTMAGLSVLVGLGVAWMATHIRLSICRKGISAALVSLIVVENLMIPLSFGRAPLEGHIPPVYEWLAAQPGTGPVLELPILMDVGAVESPRLYYSTFHWKRLVNGYGGFFPPVYGHFLFFDREFPDQPYPWIVGLGVQYVVLHRWQYDLQDLQEIDRRLQGFEDRLRLAADFGDDQVYEVIQPGTGMPNRPLTDLTWNGQAVLLGYALDPPAASPGDTVEVRLFWQRRDSMSVDYTVFVHLLDDAGALVAQHDGQPARGERPTSTWRPDEVVADIHPIVIPLNALPGAYEVTIGMYELSAMDRLPLHGLDGMMTTDSLLLGRLQVMDQE